MRKETKLMGDTLIKNDELFGNYYNKINDLILKTK